MHRERIQHLYRYLLCEPYSWLFSYCFQPARFEREMEPRAIKKRIVLMMRLSVPMLSIVFLVSLLLRMGLCSSFPALYNQVDQTPLSFLLHTLRGCVEGLLIGVLCGVCVDLTFAISLGLAGGLAGGILTHVQTTSVPLGFQVGTLVGLVIGISAGLTFGLSASRGRSSGGVNLLSTLIGCGIGMLTGMVVGLLCGFLAGMGVIRMALPLLGYGGLFAQQWIATAAGAIASSMIFYSLFVIVRNMVRQRGERYTRVMSISQTIGIPFAVLAGTSSGTVAIAAFFKDMQPQAMPYSVALGPIVAVAAAISFLVCYLPAYYRLPLYPISAFSTWMAYRTSQKEPHQVFYYLQRSALYWDERVFLSLPGVRQALLLAANVDAERMHEIIDFVVTERPEQIPEVRDATVAIVLGELEQCEDLRCIIDFAHWFDEMLPQGNKLITGLWVIPFERMKNASRNAARYYSPVSWQARRHALQEMITSLKKVHPDVAFEQDVFNRRLRVVVERWLAVARKEQEKLISILNDIGTIPNPYISGQAIQRSDTMFVGRHDLGQHLEQALDRQHYRPTFFLTGERRMGKSSTLNQLSNLLSAHYLPIVLDLQFRGKSSSTSTFLWSIAKAAASEIEHLGISLKTLEYAVLKEAGRENEAAIYHSFDLWLRELEQVLTQADRVLLLAFDEFEKLEEAGRQGYLDLHLLLDWFRCTIQHSPRLAFLFSGVKHLGEMGANWAGYFVNVETLKVSFLRPAEARRLITRPIPDYPSEQLFGEGVVEEIMHVTGCHPFLVQAVCSKLIDGLNTSNRDWAEVRDVAVAVNQVLEGWWSTYFQDLWERTSEDQRICLLILKERGSASALEIAAESNLNRKAVLKALYLLCQRDIVLQEQEGYQIATPIFSEWVERNS
jgi:hypothetical protein